MSKTDQPEFNVLLHQRDGHNLRGFTSGRQQLMAAPFYKSVNDGMGVADSIEAVQQAGLLQVPAYLIAHGRTCAIKQFGADALEQPVWPNWFDTHGERLTLNVESNYNGVQRGQYVVDIQGAGLFMPCPEDIREAVRGGKLQNYAFPISQERIELLLGERHAYIFKDGSLQTVPILNFFTSHDEFEEWAGSDAFNPFEMPPYVVVRSADDARKNPSGIQSIAIQLTNPDLAIPVGGKKRLKAMLVNDEGQSHFGWTNYCSYHDGYQNMNGGRVLVLGNHSYGGVIGDGGLDSSGRSLGVAPEALSALENGVVSPNLEQVLTLGKTHVSPAGQEAYGIDARELFSK